MDPIFGVLCGTALGDSEGLPWEGLGAGAIAVQRGPGLFGWRLVSDDTEHTLLVAEALAGSGGDLEVFRRRLGRGLARWLLRLPPGIGLGTLLACLKLLVGVSPARSGVRRAGNGAAMRAALLGVALPPERVRDWVVAASRVTHTDPRAVEAAVAVAELAAVASRRGRDLSAARAVVAGLREREVREPLERAVRAVARGLPVEDLLEELGIADGVPGYAPPTVAVAVYLWLRGPGVEEAVAGAVRAGGDTDSVAAIAGALCGACGPVPELVLDDWFDVGDLRALAAAVRDGRAVAPTPFLRGLARNLAVLGLVLVWLPVRAWRGFMRRARD